MAKRTQRVSSKGDAFGVLSELKKIEKINGQVRTITIEVESKEVPHGKSTIDVQEYATYVDNMMSYHFSDGTGNSMDAINTNPKIQKSLDNMVSGKSRPSDELDAISKEMGMEVLEDVLDFILEGGNRVYQPWKGTNSSNLIVEGHLYDSIVVRVARKNKGDIFYGR